MEPAISLLEALPSYRDLYKRNSAYRIHRFLSTAMANLVSALVIVSSVLLVHADRQNALSPPTRTVLELTDATFDAAIAKYDHILVDFYAPWCGHCKKLSPELDAAAPRLAENIPPIVLAKINADKYTKLASKYAVSAYPTLKFFINGFPTDYNGPRKAASFSSHLQKLVYPDVKVLSNESELREFLQNADDSFPFFVGFGLQKAAVAGLAKQHKSRAWFLVVESFSEKVMNHYDFDKTPVLIVLRPGEEEQEVYYGPFEGSDLELFTKQNILPRVNLVTAESVKSLREDGRAIALAILRDLSSEQSMLFVKKLKAAVPANRALVFAYVDVLKWPDFVSTFHIDGRSNLPTLVIWDGKSTYFTGVEDYDFSGEKEETFITSFLQDFKEGKARQHKVKGPSFMDYVTSTISLKTVYVLIFIVGLLIFAQNMWGTDNIENGQEYDNSRDSHKRNYGQRTSSSCQGSSVELSNSVDTAEKED